MSILIKGMEMPTEGYRQVLIMAEGEVFIFPSTPQDGELRFKAIPVPEHGRLGDLDKLETGLRNMAKYQVGERQQGILGCCETIRITPTVIEAEEADYEYTD